MLSSNLDTDTLLLPDSVTWSANALKSFFDILYGKYDDEIQQFIDADNKIPLYYRVGETFVNKGAKIKEILHDGCMIEYPQNEICIGILTTLFPCGFIVERQPLI